MNFVDTIHTSKYLNRDKSVSRILESVQHTSTKPIPWTVSCVVLNKICFSQTISVRSLVITFVHLLLRVQLIYLGDLELNGMLSGFSLSVVTDVSKNRCAFSPWVPSPLSWFRFIFKFRVQLSFEWLILKLEGPCSFQTSAIIYQSKRRNNPEEFNNAAIRQWEE
jgi:hypothetical protein